MLMPRPPGLRWTAAVRRRCRGRRRDGWGRWARRRPTEAPSTRACVDPAWLPATADRSTLL